MYAEMKKQSRIKALSYLKAKYPGAEDRAFFTDYTGRMYDEVIHVHTVARAAELEEICESCEGGKCRLPEEVKRQNSRPVVELSESPRGYSYLEVRWVRGISCKYESQNVELAEKYRKSGLNAMNEQMTFKTYESIGASQSVKLEAMKASRAGTNLILAGNPGTGKTHLAVAIAVYVIEQGQRALFRLVSAMLDEIQSAIRDNGDYDGLMRMFKTVPCLVLDDLGHENLTAARGSYLHQIMDYRYVHKLQTIITTNAKSIEELCEWDKEEYIKPIVSRVLERGKWVLMENTEDYRQKRGSNIV